MKQATWYFDFISPYSYFGLYTLKGLPASVEVALQPVLFAGLLKVWGQKGPAEIPTKRQWTYRACVWWAQRNRIPFQLPAAHPFNPLPLLRLAIVADCDPDAVSRIFRFVWRDGRIGDLPIEWAELVAELGLADAEARIATPDVKDALRRNTDEAIARGVFGVPTLAIGEELFWGADATEMAADFIAHGCSFPDPEMDRVAVLPAAAERAEVKRK